MPDYGVFVHPTLMFAFWLINTRSQNLSIVWRKLFLMYFEIIYLNFSVETFLLSYNSNLLSFKVRLHKMRLTTSLHLSFSWNICNLMKVNITKILQKKKHNLNRRKIRKSGHSLARILYEYFLGVWPRFSVCGEFKM